MELLRGEKKVVFPKYIHIWYQKHKHFVTWTADNLYNVILNGNNILIGRNKPAYSRQP